MHYRMEIVLPPVDDVKAAIEQIMKPFRDESESEDASSFRFWDWYQIGGRYSGSKLRQRVGAERLTAFDAELDRMGVTVSGLQFGKPELSPSSQREAVDALWRKMCPGAGDVCPMFKHSGEKLGSGDICRLSEITDEITSYAVIVAGPNYDFSGLDAKHMIHKDMWNGVTHVETKWDGLVLSAVKEYTESLKNSSEEYRVKHMPHNDWFVVTVDYHS